MTVSKKWALRITAAVLVILFLGTAGLLVILRTGYFHRYVLEKIVEDTEKATGGKVEIASFRFRWSGYADIYHFVLHGTESNPAQPLAAAQHIGIGFKLFSLVERKVDLREIIIDQPVVHLWVDESGNTNIAKPRVPTNENKPVNIFDLAIGHFVVNGGEVYCNDRQLALEGEIHDLQSKVQFAKLKTEYDGSLSYRRGMVRFGDFNPVLHDFSTRFSASTSGIRLDHAVLTSGGSRISAQATLRNYTNPTVDGTYQATIATQDLQRILKEPSLPLGAVATSGSVRYQNAPTFLDALTVEGNLSSPVLTLRSAEAQGEIRAFRGRFRLDKGSLAANDLQMDLLGGHVTANLDMAHLATIPESHLIASVRAISVDRANAALAGRPLGNIPIEGRLNGNADATWSGNLSGLRIRTDATIAASTKSEPTSGTSVAPIPLNGEVHLLYDEAGNSLSLSRTSVRTPHTNIRLDGTAGARSMLGVQVTSDDLREVDSLALVIRAAAARQGQQPPPRLLGLTGSAQLSGEIIGSLKAPRLAAQLTANNFQFRGFSARLLRTGVNLSPSEVAFTRGDLEISGPSSIKFSGTMGLRDWSYVPSEPFVAEVTANKVEIAELEHLAGVNYPAAGLLNANVSVHGSPKDPHIAGQVTANNLRYRDFSAQSLRTGINLSPTEVAFTGGDLEISGQSSIKFSGTVGLHNWSYMASEPLVAQVTATKVRVADLDKLASLKYPITGLLNANVAVHGSCLNPAGRGSLQLTQATAWGQPIRSLAFQFHGTGDSIASALTVESAAGNLNGNLTYDPRRQAYEGQIEAQNIQLNQLQVPTLQNLGIAGTLTVTAKGSGTFESPQLQATAEIPVLEIRQQKISGVKAQVNVVHQRATLNVDSTVGQAYVKADGSVDLTRDYNATATLDARRLPLGALLASYLPSPTYLSPQATGLSGQADVHLELQGPLRDPARLQAHVEIPKFSLGYQAAQCANAAPIRVDYKNSVLTLERAELKGTGTDFEMQAMVPLQATAPINASATGNIDLRVIKMFDPQVDSSGQIKFDVAARGSRSQPSFQGRIQLINAAVQAEGMPLGAERLNAEFDIHDNRIDITKFAGESGGGTLSAQGSVTYAPAVQFDVRLKADHVRLRYPQGVRAVLRGDLALKGGTQSSELNGQVMITSLSFTNSFDFSNFLNQFTGESVPPPNQGLEANMNLNVGVATAEDVYLEGAHQVSLQGSANLRIQGTMADPVILGRANLTGGEMFFMGNRYQVESGQVAFVNPVSTEPVVNLMVTTTVENFNISLSFVGPVDRLRTTYTSDPPLPPVDIINLLAFGKTAAESAAASANETASMGAESVLASGLTSEVSSQIQKFTGISNLSINPLVGGDQRNPGQEVAIQDRVTKNLLLTFATDVTSTQAVSFQVEYQFNKKWSASVSRDEWGAVAVGVKMHKAF